VGAQLIGFVPDHRPGHRDMTVHEYLDFFSPALTACAAGPPQAMVERVEEFTSSSPSREIPGRPCRREGG